MFNRGHKQRKSLLTSFFRIYISHCLNENEEQERERETVRKKKKGIDIQSQKEQKTKQE